MIMKPVAGVYGFWANDMGEIRVAQNRTAWKAWPPAPLEDHDGALWIKESHTGVQHHASVLVWETFVGPVPFGQIVKHHDGDHRNLSLENLYLEEGGE